MSDFFIRLAQRTLGLLPTVKPLIAPMFAHGLLWGRDRAFDTVFDRRSKTTNLLEQSGETQASTDRSTLELTSLITSEEAFPGMPKVGSLFAEARSTPSQTYPNAAHPASLSSVLPSSTPGKPPSSSDVIQPYSSHSVIEQVLEQSVDRTALDSSGWQPITNTLSGSSSSPLPSRSNESSPTGLEIPLSQPTIESESRQPKPLSSSNAIRNLDSITQSNFQPELNPPSTIPSELFDPPLTNVSPLPSIEPPIAQPESVHRQSPAIYNAPESITRATPQFSTEGLPNSSELWDLGHVSPTWSEASSIDQPNQQPSQIAPQLSAIDRSIEPSASAHSQSSEVPVIQRQIQTAQPQPLSRTVISPSNQFPDLPLVRSQPSQAQTPPISAAEFWEEPLKNNNSIDSQNRPTRQELEAADARAILDTSASALSDGSSGTEFSANSENIVRSAEPARSSNPRFYFRSDLATSVAPAAVKPRLESTESSLMTADLSGALSDRSEERRSYIRQSLGVEPTPTVHVTIGRVEVRSVTPPTPTPSPAPPPRQESRLSLADYLKQREEGHP